MELVLILETVNDATMHDGTFMAHFSPYTSYCNVRILIITNTNRNNVLNSKCILSRTDGLWAVVVSCELLANKLIKLDNTPSFYSNKSRLTFTLNHCSLNPKSKRTTQTFNFNKLENIQPCNEGRQVKSKHYKGFIGTQRSCTHVCFLSHTHTRTDKFWH